MAFNRRIYNAMVKAIARTFRWQKLLENGTYATIAEIAEAEEINEAYFGRILRLTLLAPDTIELIVSGRNPQNLDLASLMRPFPVIWVDQPAQFMRSSRNCCRRQELDLVGQCWFP
jgi:hypothetical protein